MAIFNFFKKDTKPFSPQHYADDVWVRPEYDYDPEIYNKNYPRNYPMTSYAVLEDGVVFTRDVNDFLLREKVKRVIFTDAPFPEDFKLVDLSLAQDRSILAWNQTINNELCLIISTGEKGKGIEFNKAINMMFMGFYELESVEWNNVITTRNTVSMREVFSGCKKLENLDLSSFDVSNVKYMNGMFVGCKNLTDIKWFRFNTSKVENTSYMFSNCWSLLSIDLSGFDTTSLYDCRGMFNKCASLKALNLGSFYPTAEKIKRDVLVFKDPNNLDDYEQSYKIIDVSLNTEGMFNTTGILSVLTTNNPLVKKEYFNPDEASKACLEENNIIRKVVPVSEWKVPVYDWELNFNRSEAICR